MRKKRKGLTSETNLRSRYISGTCNERSENEKEIRSQLGKFNHKDYKDDDKESSSDAIIALGGFCVFIVIVLATILWINKGVGVIILYVNKYQWWAYGAFLFACIWTMARKKRNSFLSFLLFITGMPFSVNLFAFIFHYYGDVDYITWESRPETDNIALLQGTASFLIFILLVPFIIWKVVNGVANLINPKKNIQ
ncbi:hypothetical protein SFC65_19500 [Priestia filamentosa]|uniref:hypothetical protein n=1 Tax=Priestia filamentosa TaxID=1402861 RepID=UPI003981D2D8